MTDTATTSEIETSELVSWLSAQSWSSFAQDLARFYSERGYLTPKQEASARSMYAKCTAKTAARNKTSVVVPVGIHCRASDGTWSYAGAPNTIIKVYTTQSGNLVGKVLVETTDWEGNAKYDWDYRGKRALKDLSEDTLMPFEEARKFGRVTSQCVNCLATLSDERSLAAGYGPTCANNHGWWYPTKSEAMEIIMAEGLEVPTA